MKRLLGTFFTAKEFLGLEKAALLTFPALLSEGKSPGGSRGCGERCPSSFSSPPFEMCVFRKANPRPPVKGSFC